MQILTIQAAREYHDLVAWKRKLRGAIFSVYGIKVCGYVIEEPDTTPVYYLRYPELWALLHELRDRGIVTDFTHWTAWDRINVAMDGRNITIHKIKDDIYPLPFSNQYVTKCTYEFQDYLKGFSGE